MSCLRLPKLLLLLLALCSSIFVVAQERAGVAIRVFSGRVIDQETKTPLEGVTVNVKNTQTVTTTDDKGNFTIQSPSADAVLTFSYVGFSNYETKAGPNMLVSLYKQDNSMEDVVVVGYGTKKRVNVLGAVSTVKAADIEDLPVANLGSSLINRVPGVSVSFSSGKPGSTTNINIRNSIVFPGGVDGVTTQPLYVIDGIIVNPTTWSQSANPDFFENLDASQIEDITFLKDASAAIYGAAGAKGVVLITTKKGKAGKAKISYSSYLGVSTEAVKTKTLSAYEHGRYLQDGWEMTGAANNTRFSEADLEYLKTLPDRNWFDQLWKAGSVQRHTINVSGGTERVTFFAGGSYYKEKGNYGNIYTDKYSIRTGMNAKIAEGFTANVSFSTDFNTENRNTLKQADNETDNIYIRAMYLTPKWVPLTINGQPTAFNGPNPPGNWSLVGLERSGNYKLNKSQGLSTNVSLEYKPNFVKGLTTRVQFGKLNRNATAKEYWPPYTTPNWYKVGQNGLFYSDSVITPVATGIPTVVSIGNTNSMSEGSTLSDSYQFIGMVSYARKFGESDFDIMVGFDQSEAEGRNMFLTKTNQLVAGVDEFWAFSNDPSSVNSLAETIRNPQVTKNVKRSWLGRMNYIFRNKYFLEVIARYDASSNFAPENRWGLFPTVGIGWKISDENFFRDNIRFIEFLKLRANLGIVGEDRTAQRLWESRFTSGSGMMFGGSVTNGLDPNIYPNRDITWEKSRTLNVGFDATALKGKLTITAEFYHRYTYDGYDKLENAGLSITSGINSAVVNYGKQISWGSEFSVGYRSRFSRDWGFNADVIFGWSNSMLLQSYYNYALLGRFGKDPLEVMIGRDPRRYNGSNYGYIATGIIRTQAEVDAILAKNPNYTIDGQKPQAGFMNFKDINGDGKINDQDITFMYDKTTPVVSFGITLGVTYKEFRLQTNLNLTIGGKKFYDSEAKKVPTTTQNGPAYFADHWTPGNPNGKYPRADAPLAKENSTFWAVSGTQSRINNMVLSYSVPKRIIDRYKIPELRVLLTGTNLWNIINPFKYKDPYTSDFASYPILRTISVGINVGI